MSLVKTLEFLVYYVYFLLFLSSFLRLQTEVEHFEESVSRYQATVVTSTTTTAASGPSLGELPSAAVARRRSSDTHRTTEGAAQDDATNTRTISLPSLDADTALRCNRDILATSLANVNSEMDRYALDFLRFKNKAGQ